MVSIINNVVYGGPAYSVPAHLSFGQYLVDKFRAICEQDADRIAMVPLNVYYGDLPTSGDTYLVMLSSALKLFSFIPCKPDKIITNYTETVFVLIHSLLYSLNGHKYTTSCFST